MRLARTLESSPGMMKTLLVLPVLLAACADSTPTANLSDTPSNPVAFQELHAGAAPAAIATGGIQVITIPDDPNSVGWSGTASGGFAVEPFGDVWPNMVKPEYHVRALGDDTGTFSIQTDHGIASGTVTSAEVARVDAQLLAGTHTIEVALYAADGQRLIDGSLAIHDAGDSSATQPAWDDLAVTAPGTHTLVITADSMPEAQLTVSVP